MHAKKSIVSALNGLKQALCDATEQRLSVADFNKPFDVRVDADDSTACSWIFDPN